MYNTNEKIHADAIIFDKDGTLLDFDAFWVPMSTAALKEVLTKLQQSEDLLDEIMETLKIHNGTTSITSVLCHGTFGDLAQIMHPILEQHGVSVPYADLEKLVTDAFNRNRNQGEIKPTCPNLREVLSTLKEHHIKLAVVTSDDTVGAAFCLKQLGIDDLFDKIYADGGPLPPKPCPDCALDFCKFAHTAKEDVLMVGDTLADTAFAHNAGIQMVGVAKTEENEQLLHQEAEMVVHDVSDILTMLI